MPILCVLTLDFIDFWVIPLVFSVILILFNFKEFNYLFIIKFITASYISFLACILTYSIIGNLLELMLEKNFQIGEWSITDLSFLITVGIISPILFFYINSLFIRKINFFNNFRIIIIGIIIVFLSIILIFSYNFNSDYSFKIWQFVIAFILQYILLNNFNDHNKIKKNQV